MHEVDEDAPLSPAVIDTLVSSHRAFLAFLEKRVGDRALAEDLLQEAFARGIARGRALRDGDSAVAWFYASLRNAVIDHRRRDAASGRKLDALARELEAHAPREPEIEEAVCRCVGELAATLKPEYADALRRIELEGASVKDYADELGITAGNAGVRVFRAREALRRQVLRTCGTCADHGCLDCTCRRP